MNFFEQQHKAKKNSTRLVVLFSLAVIAIIVAVYFPIQYLMAEYFWSKNIPKDNPIIWSYKIFFYVALTTISVIFIASYIKIRELGEGGHSIAHMMNGRLIDHPTQDFKEKQLLNVVEEMALASGIPSPNVYILDTEYSINAFAAGYTIGDAVIGVTRGTVDKLNREELQGVIGHEFSHILNGDMRLNIKLIGLLHGILVIALFGRLLLSGKRSHRRRSGKGGGGLILLGLSLWIIGWVGHFFGKLIQSAVSRQREFLADASAVQFTRNINGIGNALKKIGGYMDVPATGSHLLSGYRQEIAHMTFASVNFSEMFGWTSSHPKIEKRIQLIDKSFDPKLQKRIEALPHIVTQPYENRSSADEKVRNVSIDNFEIPVSKNIKYTAGAISGLVGTTPHQAIDQQKIWLQSLPKELYDACHNCIKARSVTYALLTEYDEGARNVTKSFLKLRDTHALESFNQLWDSIKSAGPEARLRLIDLCIPALRKLSPDEYKMFIQNLIDLIKMDQKVSLFELLLMKIVKKHLNNHKKPQKPRNIHIHKIEEVESELSTLLASIQIQTTHDVAAIENALKKLSETSFPVRQQVIESCAQAAFSDKIISWKEGEILRAIGDALDCPIPHLNTSN